VCVKIYLIWWRFTHVAAKSLGAHFFLDTVYIPLQSVCPNVPWRSWYTGRASLVQRVLERVKCKPIVITRPCLNAILLLAVCRRSVFNSPWLLQVQHLRSTAGRIQRCAGLVRTNAYRASSSRVWRRGTPPRLLRRSSQSTCHSLTFPLMKTFFRVLMQTAH